MDSISNLSLLEIAAEDDSLLLDVPASTDVFSCSPLISLRSKPPHTEGNVSGPVDSENDANKENANWSKPEAPKLSVERQQMKRKKKGGGYNLRKSLAWDRAFFTEQGVLNATELSMISGTATPNSELNLEVIHEEEHVSTSLALQEIEENLFKESSDHFPVEVKKSTAGSGLHPKHVALAKNSPAPASLAKRKVLAVNDVVGNRSKRSACPRPVASSSRPDPVKASSRETKVTKIPGPKSNVSVSATTARSGTSSTGSSKRSQNARPVSVTNVQKNAGVKGLSKNPKTAPFNPKVDLTDKCSVARTLTKQDGKHLDNSVSETHPPSKMHQVGTGVNKASECLPRVVSDTEEKRQQTQFQTTKPSGLRMPSPSIGFFSQAKTTSQLQKSSKVGKPAESNIPKLKKSETISVNETRLPHAPRKRSEIVEGAAKNCSKKLSCSDVKSEPCMEVDNEQVADAVVKCNSLVFEKISKQEKVEDTPEYVCVKSDEQGEQQKIENVSGMEDALLPIREKQLLSRSLTHEQLEKEAEQPIMKVYYKQVADVEVECNSLGFEKLSKQEKLENIFEPSSVKSKDQGEELHKSENASSMEDVLFARHEKKFFPKSLGHVQLEEEADHNLDGKAYNVLSSGDQSVFQEPQSMPHHDNQRTSTGKDSISSTVYNAMGQDEGEQTKVLACDILESNESSVQQEQHGATSKDRRHSGEFKECSSVNNALLNCSLIDFSEAVSGGSVQGISCKYTDLEVDGGTGDFGMCGGDAQVHLLNGNLSFNCNETTQSNLEAVNQQLCGEQLMTLNPNIVAEISLKKENESHLNSFQQVQVTTLSSNGSSENKGASESESKLVETENCQFPVDGQSGFIRKIPMDEGYDDQVIDSKTIYDRTQEFELDRLNEDSTAVSATACCSNVFNVPLDNRPFCENNIGNLHLTTQLCPLGKADCDSRGNEPHVNSCQLVHMTNLSPKGSPEMSIQEMKDASESESKLVETEDCQLPVDDQSVFISRVPIDEGYDQVIASKSVDDTIQAFESDRLTEDCTNVSATACCTEVMNVSLESRPFCESNIGSLPLTSESSPIVKADCDARGNDMSINNCCAISELQLRSDGSSWDTSMHCNVQHNVPGNCEQQASMFVFSETNEMLYEDESSVPNHGHMIDQSEFSEASTDFISNLKDSTGSEAENPSALSQCTLLAHSVLEFDNINREVEESHVEGAPVQSPNENPVAHNCPNDHCLAVTDDQFSLADDNNMNEDSHISEIQRASIVSVDSQGVDNILHFDGEWHPTNVASSEKVKTKNVLEVAIEGCDVHTNENNTSHHYIQGAQENNDENLDMDEVAELFQMDEFDSSKKVSKEPPTVVVEKSEEHCSLSDNSNLPASDYTTFNIRIPQDSEANSLNRKKITDRAETIIFEKDEFPNTGMQDETKGDVYSAEDSSKILNLSPTKSKQEAPTVKPPPNVAPFSDEWLAAIEAAGEEILTIKSGPVQNSPPEKPQHEPGPWSPVKRKNQVIGPFDCTKHTNVPHSSSQ